MYGIYPPGINSALFYMGTVFAYLLGFLLAAEWVWRVSWSFFEHKAPFRSPATAVRAITFLLLVVELVFIWPRLWLYMRWPRLTLAERIDFSEAAAQSSIVAVVIFTTAWLLSYLGEPMIRYQLVKEPLPLHLWPSWEQMKRPLKIGLGVFAIAFALTYLR